MDRVMQRRILRVLTLNCWNLAEPFAERMALIRDAVAGLEPDLIALQEVVVRRDGFDQGALILDGLGYQRVFGARYRWDERGTFLAHHHEGDGVGNLLAARWPIVERAVRALPGAEGEEHVTALAALVETPGGALPFFTTHLDWRFDHGWIRERQVVALAAFVGERRRGRHLPPILAGDLNAEPDSTEVRFLRGLAALEGRSAYFQDAWEIAGDGGRGFTWDNRNRFAAYMLEPNRRIDYVLVGLPDRQGRGVVEAARLVLDRPHGDVFASDHFGVLADVRILPAR
jgi:endonuclease/exonuclease/phosphatase family metal-dependent hydrolase